MKIYLLALFFAADVLSFAAAQGGVCGNLIKSISFEGAGRIGQVVDYIEELAYQDFAPYSYLDGFHGDQSTRGTTNERALAIQEGNSRVLQVALPEGCVTSACAMQAKSLLLLPVDEATLKFKMKFGPNFAWVNGGKLPGLCGARCLTGCKEVTGLDGFSSRQMWRPCVWPPEHEDNEINCTGGKLVAYVYHMFKEHWCGDDFEFENELWARTYSTNRVDEVPKEFFQPNPDEWYTVWSYIKMNSAGSPNSAENFQQDGVLQTWLEGPNFPPLLVVDKQDMGWRRYNNVSIDTLYFSVFYGGSSPKFEAEKDETISFDDFQVWEGKCAPGEESISSEVVKPEPTWPNMRTNLDKPTVLLTNTNFNKAFTGGGCATFEVQNTADVACDRYEIEVNVRPSWGTILQNSAGELNLRRVTLLAQDDAAGWFLAQSEGTPIGPGLIDTVAGVCVQNYASAKYLPKDLNSHVVALATCIEGPAAQAQAAILNPLEVKIVDPIAPVLEPAPPPPVESPVPVVGEILPSEEKAWCRTTASEGGIWNLFDIIKTKLCSGQDGFDKPWGPVDIEAVSCDCGEEPLFPDNACVAVAASSAISC